MAKAKTSKIKKALKVIVKEEPKVVLDMTFEEAMKKAFNTPLPKNKKNK